MDKTTIKAHENGSRAPNRTDVDRGVIIPHLGLAALPRSVCLGPEGQVLVTRGRVIRADRGALFAGSGVKKSAKRGRPEWEGSRRRTRPCTQSSTRTPRRARFPKHALSLRLGGPVAMLHSSGLSPASMLSWCRSLADGGERYAPARTSADVVRGF